MPLIDERTTVDSEVLTTFFAHASDAALVINKMRRILTMNTAATEVTGWKQRDLTSINCSVLGCRDEQGKKTCGESCLAQRCIETGQPIGLDAHAQTERRSQHGTPREFDHRLLPSPFGRPERCRRRLLPSSSQL